MIFWRGERCGRAMQVARAGATATVSADLVEGSVATGATGWRIPAAEIEEAVARTLAARLRDPGFLSDAQLAMSVPLRWATNPR